jgi:tRNA pseudouridine55 synthase
MKTNMDGILIVNKTKGCTSHDIVYQVKKIVNEKVGHTGTLDPMATGVLPLLVGKGTLCSKYLMNHDKVYRVKLQLGQKTDTLDGEGNIIEEKQVTDNMIEKEKVEEVLKSMIGKQEQIPPIYSAIKVNGKKLYEYARKGEKVEIKPRKIEIYNIELIKINKKDRQIEFQVACSKGTYIRSLCEEIASKLNTVGYMCELERLQVGKFNIVDAITLETFKFSFILLYFL